MLLSPILKIDNKSAPKKALQNPSTSNPGATNPANINKSALITKVKSPKVKIFIGRVTNKRTGFINTFTRAITNAAIIAVRKFATEIPGTTQAINIMTNAKPTHFKNKYIKFSFLYLL